MSSDHNFTHRSPEAREVWNLLFPMLSDEREQRLLYLLYNCGLKPQEIARLYPQEWCNDQEVYRLLAPILARLRSTLDVKSGYSYT